MLCPPIEIPDKCWTPLILFTLTSTCCFNFWILLYLQNWMVSGSWKHRQNYILFLFRASGPLMIGAWYMLWSGCASEDYQRLQDSPCEYNGYLVIRKRNLELEQKKEIERSRESFCNFWGQINKSGGVHILVLVPQWKERESQVVERRKLKNFCGLVWFYQES